MHGSKKLTRIFITLILISFANIALAVQELPQDAPYPGGVAIINLKYNAKNQPKIYYHNHRVLVLANQNNPGWIAIVGIPLDAKQAKQKLLIVGKYQRGTQFFTINEKTYPLRHLTIKDKSKVTPNAKLARVIRKQTKQMRDILNQWYNSDHVYLDFQLPVKGPFSSPFGQRRIYNKVKHGRHTGLDIAAGTGTPIHAAANGKVIAVKDFIITGNTVFVAHGQGLITFYCHMHTVDVKPGQNVVQGEPLGTVGSTGRVTGAHLHWGTSLNGVLVNPILFVNKKTLERYKNENKTS